MAGPATKNLEVYQGDTYELQIRLRDVAPDGTLGAYINLTGSVLKAQIRQTKTTDVLAEFSVVFADQTQPATVGQATLTLSATQTAALPGDVNLIWDLQRTDAQNKVRTLLKGSVAMTGEVTR